MAIRNHPKIFKTVKIISKKTKKNKKIAEKIHTLPKYKPNPLLPFPYFKLALVFRPKENIKEFFDCEEFRLKDKDKTLLEFYPKGEKFQKSKNSPIVLIVPGFSSTSSDRYMSDTCRDLWKFGGLRTVIINSSTFVDIEIDEHYDQNWFKLNTVDDVCEYLRTKESTKNANYYLMGLSAGADYVHYYSGIKAKRKEKTEIFGSVAMSPSFDIQSSLNKIERSNYIVSRVIIAGYKVEMRKYFKNKYFLGYLKKNGLSVGNFFHLNRKRVMKI